MARIPVADNFRRLLAQEDTDGDRCITVRDHGPRSFEVQGSEPFTLRGTYPLANLLQELALARRAGLEVLEIDPERLTQNPLDRLSQAIRERCWHGLTRWLRKELVAEMLKDPKFTVPPRLYLSPRDLMAREYYSDFRLLPEMLTPEYVVSINHQPGLLGLALDTNGQPIPYLVPGGRFNEMYGWDSYFMSLGLIQDGLTHLAESVLQHFCYQIEHYGQILNANRTYYLTRSQPPFLPALARQLGHHDPRLIRCARHEYARVWTGPTRLTDCGLSRYFCSGFGMPPETAMRHYGRIMAPFAEKHGLSVAEFRKAYEARHLVEPELDDYFREDRAVRESGHDTSYRLESVCTQLCTVDLNSLLFRYEQDMAELDSEQSSLWRQRANDRRERMNRLCWDERQGQFFDYNFTTGQRTGFVSCTNLFPLWAGLASPHQAAAMVAGLLPQLECKGGLAGGTEASRGPVSETRPPRQWDYPYGWAPHQMLVWEGLKNYGYMAEASRLAQRWLTMITQTAVDFNGVIAEKYDVVQASHEVKAEYANMGADFDYVSLEGFGWTNASYQVGLTYLDENQKGCLRALADQHAI